MSYSQKYTLVSFFEPIAVGKEFDMSDWPPHITLADVFAVDINSGVQEKLAQIVAKTDSFNITAAKESTLGTTQVVLIDTKDALLNLHNSVVDILEQNGTVFNSPEFTRFGFIPHFTIQKTGKLRNGEAVLLNTISLIDMFPEGDWKQRKVLRNFKLNTD